MAIDQGGPKRVVHLITKGDVGGAQSVVRELALGLRSSYDIHVATGRLGPVTEALASLGVPIHSVPSLGRSVDLRGDRQAYLDLQSLTRRLRPDLLHAHSSKAGFLGRLIARRDSIASVYTAHGWPFQVGAPAGQRAVSYLGECAAGHLGGDVVCVNAADLRRARRGRVAPLDRLRLIENGVSDVGPDLLAAPGSGSGPLRVVMVARFAAPKRQDLAIRAACKLDGAVKLQLIGDGPEEPAARALAHELDPSGCIVSFDASSSSPDEMYRDADVGLLVSDFEGMPMTLLESMRAGLPILVNRLDVAGSLGVTDFGWVVDRSEEALATAFRFVVGDRSVLPKLGRLARGVYLSRFTAGRMVQDYGKLYREVLYREVLDR